MDRKSVGIAIGLVFASTLVLASAMLGGLALLTATAPAIESRVPFYLLGGAGVFTALIIWLERQIDDGLTIITVSIAVGVVGTITIALGVEGLLLGYRDPDRMLSHLFVYLLAAGLISTGVIFWAVRHWREFTRGHEIV